MEDKYGKFCYEGYKASCEGKTWDGKEMMPWEDIPNEKQIHWIIGANNVVDKFINTNCGCKIKEPEETNAPEE